jgi:hypothetical protein
MPAVIAVDPVQFTFGPDKARWVRDAVMAT